MVKDLRYHLTVGTTLRPLERQQEREINFFGLSAAPPTQLGDSFLIFLDNFGDCRQNFILKIRGF